MRLDKLVEAAQMLVDLEWDKTTPKGRGYCSYCGSPLKHEESKYCPVYLARQGLELGVCPG